MRFNPFVFRDPGYFCIGRSGSVKDAAVFRNSNRTNNENKMNIFKTPHPRTNHFAPDNSSIFFEIFNFQLLKKLFCCGIPFAQYRLQ
jgi:hypothetical protein